MFPAQSWRRIQRRSTAGLYDEVPARGGGATAAPPGWAVQVDPIKPTLTAPESMLLKLRCDGPVSNFAFKFNLRRYNLAIASARAAHDAAMSRGDAKRAMGAAALLAALAPPAAAVDAESHIEAARAAAEAHLCAGRLVDAHAGAARQFAASQFAAWGLSSTNLESTPPPLRVRINIGTQGRPCSDIGPVLVLNDPPSRE